MDLASAILEKNLTRLHEYLDEYQFSLIDAAELAAGTIEKNWMEGLEAVFSKCQIGEDGLDHLIYVTFRKPTHWECLRFVLSQPHVNYDTVREVYVALVQGLTACPAYQGFLEAEFPHMLSGWARLLPPIKLVRGVVPSGIARALRKTGDKLHPNQLTAALDMDRSRAKAHIAALLPYCDPLDMLRDAIYTGDYEWVIEYVCRDLGYDPSLLIGEVGQVLRQLEACRPQSTLGPTVWEHLDSDR